MSLLPSKVIAETITVTFDFTSLVPYGDSLGTPVVTVVVLSGVDSSPSSIISGASTLSGSVVTQKITAGLGGVVYGLLCTLTGALKVYTVQHTLAILSNTGSFGLGTGLSIVGILPATACYGGDIFLTLPISQGYAPYGPVTISSGVLPIGWSVTVVGSNIIISGISTQNYATYNFTIRLVDFVGNVATSAQTIKLIDCTPTIFIAVADAGLIAKSTDGQNWTLVTSGTTRNIISINYGGGKFFGAVDTSPPPRSVISSTNGDVWTYAALPLGTIGGGKVGYSTCIGNTPKYFCGYKLNESYVSDDALTWSIVVISASVTGISCVSGSPTQIVLGDTDGKLWTSGDAVTWAFTAAGFNIGQDVNDAIWVSPNNVVAASAGTFTYPNVASYNGATWTTDFAGTLGMYAITYGSSVYVVCGNSATIFRSSDAKVTWDSITNPFTFSINDVQYGNGVVVACANGGQIGYSLDLGLTWTLASSPFGSSNVNGLAFGQIS